ADFGFPLKGKSASRKARPEQLKIDVQQFRGNSEEPPVYRLRIGARLSDRRCFRLCVWNAFHLSKYLRRFTSGVQPVVRYEWHRFDYRKLRCRPVLACLV